MRVYRQALITGASSGIGASFAAMLPAETNLLLTARRRERLLTLADRLQRPGRQVEVLAADLATNDGCATVIERANASAIDLLICNAGSGVYGPYAETPASAEREALALNIMSPCELIHSLLPGMLTRARTSGRRGGIILVGSVAGFSPMVDSITYAAAKSFDLQFGRGLAEQLRSEPFDVLTLLPGYTRTEFFASAGLPDPDVPMMSADDVAREGLSAIGSQDVFFCGRKNQRLAWLVATNPALAVWRWPRKLLHRLKR